MMKTLLTIGRSRKRTPIDYGHPKEKQLAIPDQALSLREIVSRYVRGVPVDVKQRNPVWIDQNDYDLESLSRSEFSEKMSVAEELREKYDRMVAQREEAIEAKRKEAQELAQKEIEELRKFKGKKEAEASAEA